MNRNMNPQTLATNHSAGHHEVLAPSIRLSGQGACQPPRNMVAANPETVAMLMYSASMNMAKRREEYSVWKPPTSSPSASGRSKGALFVSPTIAVT
ncbi:Uncharacterised protein [Mycobacteroides abscessus subsp. abscessus]|nr:Uncharacterised protein [Mycobacteroides abscessus subsp. abscessus]